MKYTNLIGRTFDFTGFRYSTKEVGASHITEGRGAKGMKYTPVTKHEIYKGGVLDGQECIWEGEFLYPITELERTNQLTEKDLLYEEVYSIY